MPAGLPYSVDTRAMKRAMDAVSRESTRADHEVITMNARTILRAVVFNTPRDTGTGRAGWWPAWSALQNPGTPGTPRRLGAQTDKRGRGRVAVGRVDDQRNASPQAYFEFGNSTIAIRKGGPFRYLYASNAKGKSAGWMQRAADEAEFKFGKIHATMLRRHSAL